MAGHSKWNNIQHRKGAQDAKRSKIFTKVIREVTVAARAGDPNPDFNPRLRQAIEKALSVNMQKDRIEHAIKKGSGELDGENFEEMRYEGRAVGGVAVIVDCLTDNKNRTVSEVRHAFTKRGGALGTAGSASYLFQKKGYLLTDMDEEQALEIAIEFGVEDVQVEAQGVLIITPPNDTLSQIRAHIEKTHKILHCDFDMQPDVYLNINAEQKEKIIDLIDVLENLDDVQKIYTNAMLEDE